MPRATRTATTTSHGVIGKEGYVTGLSITQTGGVKRGQVYVRIDIRGQDGVGPSIADGLDGGAQVSIAVGQGQEQGLELGWGQIDAALQHGPEETAVALGVGGEQLGAARQVGLPRLSRSTDAGKGTGLCC